MTPIEPSMSELPATELEAIKQRWEKARLYYLSYYMNATDIPQLFAEIERLRKLAELWGKERAELEAALELKEFANTGSIAIHEVPSLRIRAEVAERDTARLDWLEADPINVVKVVHNVGPGRCSSVREFIDKAALASGEGKGGK